MKKVLFLLIALPVFALAQTNASLPAIEKDNGGDNCTQTLAAAKQALVDSLKYSNTYGINLDVFLWVVQKTEIRLVPKTFVGGVETDARNMPNYNLIEISKSRWCALSKIEQPKILFHEYLGIMNIEGTNDYHVSTKFLTLKELKQWVCQAPLYWVQHLMEWEDYYINRGQSKPYFGPTIDKAWNNFTYALMSEFRPEHEGLEACVRVQVVEGEYATATVCVEPATMNNSCTQNREN